jgi:hypothetical protein
MPPSVVFPHRNDVMWFAHASYAVPRIFYNHTNRAWMASLSLRPLLKHELPSCAADSVTE